MKRLTILFTIVIAIIAGLAFDGIKLLVAGAIDDAFPASSPSAQEGFEQDVACLNALRSALATLVVAVLTVSLTVCAGYSYWARLHLDITARRRRQRRGTRRVASPAASRAA